MQVSYVRWKPGSVPVPQYQYYEPAKAAWVDCPREMALALQKRGTVHWNPSFNPAVELARAAEPKARRK